MAELTRRDLIAAAAGSAAILGASWMLDQSTAQAQPTTAPNPLSLWYNQPADQWIKALPVGNGRLGAMIFGNVENERLQLNEDTLWAGGPYDPVNPEALAALPEAQKLVFEGQYKAAHDLIGAKILSKPLKQMQYQTAGDLLLAFPSTEPAMEYRRELNLDTAVHRTSYRIAATTYTREVFASPVDQVIVTRLSATQGGRISCAVGYQLPRRSVGSVSIEDGDTILLTGTNTEAQGIAPALKYEVRTKVIPTNGNVRKDGERLSVDRVDSVLLITSIATSYKRFDDVSGDPVAINKAAIEKASARSFDAMLADHVSEHQKLFRRVSIDLGTTDAANLPTDERIAKSASLDDPALAALYFQYARYLLICSSRPGCQPANLQGIWNDSNSPPWGSKYTININTEMNYWPAEPTNLSECVEPLIDMVRDLSITGARTAKSMYGARGWVAHHNTDLWRATGPIDGPQYGMWPTGGAWLCKHLFDKYEFHPNAEYLREVYPLMKGAAEFFVDTLIEEPKTKYLVTNPSLSPENAHPFETSVCAGPMMDSQIIRDLFNNCIKSSEILGVDSDFRAQLQTMEKRLPPNKIGSQGQLQEWMDDWDAKARDQRHRHISHLYALYPSHQIDPATTPELAEACKTTLNTRGDVTTGWAIAWRINCWARLRDAERTHKIIKLLLDPSRTYPNMFDAHPPFQIDGNFGGASGICEMLLQSHNNEIHLLPALPKAWPSGKVSGLRARGGFEVDIEWKDGVLSSAVVRASRDSEAVVRYADAHATQTLKQGASAQFDGRLQPSK